MGPFVIVQALWLFVPAYFANMTPVFAAKIFPKWKSRIDGGRTWTDGRPLLGEGKTWRGLWTGSFVGVAMAVLQATLARFSNYDVSDFAYASTGGLLGPVVLGFVLGFGAGLGDAIKSFFKRRTGREGGKPWFPFDQLDFVVGGLFLAATASWMLSEWGFSDRDWFLAEFGRHWGILMTLLVLTPLLHFLVNVIGYRLRLKQVPW